MSSETWSPRSGAALALLAVLTAACGGCLLAVHLAPPPLRAGVASASAAAGVVLCAAVTTAAYQALTCRRLRERLRALTAPRQAPAAPQVPRQWTAREAEIDLVSLVVSTGAPPHGAPHPQQALLWACRTPVTVAEAAARLRLPVDTVRALIDELLADGRLAVRAPAVSPEGERPGTDLLVRVLDGLRAL